MKQISLCYIAVVAGMLSFNVNAYGQNGCFKASDACEAFQSYRKKTNPGNLRLKTGNAYKVLEVNRAKSTYRIEIKDAKRPLRWVEGRCGELLPDCNITSLATHKLIKKTRSKKTKKPVQNLLALSWTPSFCESKPRRKECRTQTRNRYDASHWSLHGLWPQPRANTYCNVNDTDKSLSRNKRWHLLEPPGMSIDTATKLAFIMPGMASNLHRHEWIKHGTCYGSDADTYYRHSIALTQQVNNSVVGKLFNRGVGKRVTLKQVRQHFDKAFGKGAGSKMDMRCDRKGLVSEIWINLSGEIEDDTKLSDLMKNAIPAGSTCQMGLIDRAG